MMFSASPKDNPCCKFPKAKPSAEPGWFAKSPPSRFVCPGNQARLRSPQGNAASQPAHRRCRGRARTGRRRRHRRGSGRRNRRRNGQGKHQPRLDIIHEPDGSVILRGSVGLGRVQDLFGVEFAANVGEGGTATTVAGLLNSLAGHVPKAGESLDYDNLRFEVLEANQRKVL